MKSDTLKVVTGAPLFFHNREIGRGVPDVGRSPISAPLPANRADKEALEGAIQSTNCGGDLRHGGRQSRAGSLAEAVANVIAGYLAALLAQQIVLPVFDIHVGLATHAAIAVVFTVLSLVRSYLLRRVFEGIVARGPR